MSGLVFRVVEGFPCLCGDTSAASLVEADYGGLSRRMRGMVAGSVSIQNETVVSLLAPGSW